MVQNALPYIRELTCAFLKYLIAGGAGFLVDFGTLTFCYELLGINHLLSAAFGFIVGLIFVYISSNAWVFKKRRYRQHAGIEFVVFAVIGLVGLGLTVLFMWAFVDGFGIHPLIAKLGTTALVLLWNFGARKFILY